MERAPYFAMIQSCEAAIVRIRAAIRAGHSGAEPVGADFEHIRAAVTPRLLSYARALGSPASLAAQEALEAMYDRLFDDIWSLSFVSIETQFGAYLRSMAARVVQRVRRAYASPDGAGPLERLDEPAGPERLPRHAALADDRAEAAFAAVGTREQLGAALGALTPEQRLVIAWRLAAVPNGEIARRLGSSPSTATRVYQRAVEQLRAQLNA